MKQVLCNVCGKRKGMTGTKGLETSPHHDLCNYCFEEGGHENTHSDAGHDNIAAKVKAADGFTTELTDTEQSEYNDFMQSCWVCKPELNLAQTEKATSKGSKTAKVQGTRRTQLNHKGHSHPATSAARRACKEMFWNWAASTDGPKELTAEHFAKWNTLLDANGKVITTKPATWTVAPKGPKGGVINQLKAGKGKPQGFTAKALGITE